MKNVILNNGVSMPMIGFGTFCLKDPRQCEESVIHAIQAGYRMIDTAEAYGNEEYVGNAISKAGIPREDLFVATKVNYTDYEDATRIIENSLKKLRVDYLDMVLLHWPFANYYAAWRVLEQFYRAGTIRVIGVSNFGSDRLIDLIRYNDIKPAVNQIETHLFCQRQNEHAYMNKYGVQHEGYAPLGQGRAREMFALPAVRAIAEKYGKTPAQILLHYLTQSGIVVIPRSGRPERIQENIDIFDFELTEKEMDQLRSLDANAPMIGTPERAETVEESWTWV